MASPKTPSTDDAPDEAALAAQAEADQAAADAAAAAAEPEPPICAECWPAGWPDGAAAASCIHGKWSRPDPNAEAS